MKVRESLCCVYVVLLAGCSAADSKSDYSYQGEPATASEDVDGVISVASTAPSLGGAAAAGEEASDPIKRAGPVDRKLIYVADVNLVVTDFANTEREVPNLVKQFDGYLANFAPPGG